MNDRKNNISLAVAKLRKIAEWLLSLPRALGEIYGKLRGSAENRNRTDAAKPKDDPIGGQNDDASRSLPRFALARVVLISVVAALFISSVFLNVSLLMGGTHLTSLSSSSFHWILIIGLVIVTAVSLLISFWAHYIRSIYLKDGPALVPEQWGLVIGKLIDQSKIHHSQYRLSLEKVQKSSVEQNKKSDNLLKNFLTLQRALDVRDEEIARLKKGYDAKIFKRFLMRFIRVDRSLREMEHEFSGQEHQKNYRYLKRIMQDALEECGVEQFEPELGSDYREAGREIADDPKVIETSKVDDDFKIAKIESVGYILEGEGKKEVVVPSKVSIYQFYQTNKEEK